MNTEYFFPTVFAIWSNFIQITWKKCKLLRKLTVISFNQHVHHHQTYDKSKISKDYYIKQNLKVYICSK